MNDTPTSVRTSTASTSPSHTEAEIRQQPEVWQETAALIENRRREIDDFLAPILGQADLRIILTGAGTSAFAGGVVAPTVARATGRRVESIATTDLVSNPLNYLETDTPTLLVSFARSGNSPESMAATRLADQVLGNVHHLVVTCNAEGALALEHRHHTRSLVLEMPARSNDVGFAMTSSFTCMMLSALLVFLGDAPETVDALGVATVSLLDDSWAAIAELTERDISRLVYLGSGPLAALAQESALKALELTAGRLVSYYDSALGFRHGPKAVLDSGTLAVVYVSNDGYTRDYDLDIVNELRSTIDPSRVIVVAAAGDADIPLPALAGVDDGYLAVAYVVVAQILALSFALEVGTTPDNPFPGGAVNRVVQGVTIHELPSDAMTGR